MMRSAYLRWCNNIIRLVLIISLSVAQVSYAQGLSVVNLPVPGTMVGLSSVFAPVLVKGLVVHPDKPLNFEFIIDSGNDSTDQRVINEQSQRLAKYFLAAVTVPEDQLWVNLSPYEKDRIIESELGQTILGRDMLAQDYILKQLTASLLYPEGDLGKEFWSRIYKEAQETFGTTDISVDTFNKVWIMPDKAEVFEKGNKVFVTEARLKVMLDSDRTAMTQNALNADTDEKSAVAKAVMRKIILPAIEKEVNEGRNFAAIRQVYHAAILAKWYRDLIQNTLLAGAYVGKNKVEGIRADEKAFKEEIYQRYIEAYKKGVFNLIKDDSDPISGDRIPRQYFSGGESLHIDKLDRTGTQLKAGIFTGKLFQVDLAMSSSRLDRAQNKSPEIINEITEEMISGSTGLTVPRRFISKDGKLKSWAERRANNTFGIVEVYFPRPSQTVTNMLAFIDRLKVEFGDKIYTLDPHSLHMTTQGLERQWDDPLAGTMQELTIDQGCRPAH